MDDLTRAFYEERFIHYFLEKKATEFQSWFSDIMEKRYPGDFVRVRPWGKIGDEKNDGFLTSSRTIYQVYGPNDLSANETIQKMEEDFNGAVQHWKGYFDCWTFVHNSKPGLGPEVLKKLRDLDGQYANIKTNAFGFEEMRGVVLQLDESALRSLLGHAPSRKSLRSLRYRDLKPVLTTIASQDLPPDIDIRPVPSGKIAYNQLSRNVTILLSAGMQKTDLVQGFFNRWSDPRLGDRVAQAFRLEYGKYRNVSMAPDDIFSELQAFAGGRQKKNTTGVETAVLAVLAYLFEQCEIFERPPATEFV